MRNVFQESWFQGKNQKKEKVNLRGVNQQSGCVLEAVIVVPEDNRK